MKLFFSKQDFSLLMGNALDHYDSAIYGFLVPLLAPLFFPEQDPISQLILGYSVLGTSLITRPLGTWIFGSFSRKHGPVPGLSLSLIGVSLSMIGLGCLPTSLAVGWWAPVCLIGVRMVKGLFSAGESTLAKLYVMEDKPKDKALTASYFYQSSSMVGSILASAAATMTLFSSYPWMWRLCFIGGGLIGCIGYLLRLYGKDLHQVTTLSHSQFSLLWKYKIDILRVAIATIFGYITGTIPFVFMNTFVPLISSISLETMMLLNTFLLGLDMVLIPFIGRFTGRYPGEKVMVIASIVLALTIVPLFAYLPDSSLSYVVFVRLWIVFWGIVFMCPMNFWFKSLFPKQEQYLLVGMGGALGATTIGRLLTPACLGLWNLTGLSYAPALYLAGLMGLTAYVIYSRASALPHVKLSKVHMTGA